MMIETLFASIAMIYWLLSIRELFISQCYNLGIMLSVILSTITLQYPNVYHFMIYAIVCLFLNMAQLALQEAFIGQNDGILIDKKINRESIIKNCCTLMIVGLITV